MRLLPRSRRGRVLVAGGVLVLLAGGAGGWAWLGRGSTDGSTTLTATVTRGTFADTVTASGTITPKHQADLSFSSAGTVTAVLVAPGDRVRAGDVLARIDSTVLQAQRDAASAQLDAAEAQAADDGSASSAQQTSDDAAVDSARSQLEQAQAALDDATLTSPITGTVSAVDYQVGDTVGTSDRTASASQDASSTGITVISPRHLLVDAEVSADDVTKLRKGLEVTITPTGSTTPVYGTVQDVGVIATTSDTGAAQFPVTVAVTGTPTGLYAGASASVAITVRQATVLAVPTAAIHSDSAGTYVYVVKGTARTRRTITIGTAYGAQTQVKSGLTAGESVEIASFRRTGGGGTNRTQLPGGFGGSGSSSFKGGGAPVVIQGGP